GLAGGFTVDLFSYLFGAITAVQPGDLWLIIGLGCVVVATVAALYKELFAITFDEESARVQGIPVDTLNLVLTGLVAVTVVVAMRVVGALLTGALLVIPAATAMRLSKSFRGTVAIALACSLTAVVAGITSSFYLNIAAGGAIVLCAILLFSGTVLVRSRS
ncbi:MAG: metal ABC transporter permease, partial [Armatimonadetes bacterium]|nr:metal ABC transporter permease [Armatimonadota bacterium]